MHRQRGAQVVRGVVVPAEGGCQRCEVVVDGASVAHASAVDEVVAGQRPQPVVHLGLLRSVADRDDGFGDDHRHPAVVAADAVAAILFERVAGEDFRRGLPVASGDEQHGSERGQLPGGTQCPSVTKFDQPPRNAPAPTRGCRARLACRVRRSPRRARRRRCPARRRRRARPTSREATARRDIAPHRPRAWPRSSARRQ